MSMDVVGPWLPPVREVGYLCQIDIDLREKFSVRQHFLFVTVEQCSCRPYQLGCQSDGCVGLGLIG